MYKPTIKNNRDYLRSQKVTKRRKKNVIRKYSVILVFILIIFALLVGSLYLSPFTIKSVEVEGNQIVGTEQITAIAEPMLEGNFLYIFPKKNIIFYPKKNIEKALSAQFPRFASVVVHAVSPTKINILISERKPQSLWCKDQNTFNEAIQNSEATSTNATSSDVSSSTETFETSQCYFIDTEGYIFSLAPNFQGNAYLKFFGGNVSTTVIGSELIASSTYAHIVTLADTLQKNNLKISYITIQNENNFSIKLQDNGKILFTTDNSLSDAVTNLLVALTSNVFVTKNSKNTVPKLTPFEYIDTRFGNKIFYKLKSDVLLPSTSTSSASTSITLPESPVVH